MLHKEKKSKKKSPKSEKNCKTPNVNVCCCMHQENVKIGKTRYEKQQKKKQQEKLNTEFASSSDKQAKKFHYSFGKVL